MCVLPYLGATKKLGGGESAPGDELLDQSETEHSHESQAACNDERAIHEEARREKQVLELFDRRCALLLGSVEGDDGSSENR